MKRLTLLVVCIFSITLAIGCGDDADSKSTNGIDVGNNSANGQTNNSANGQSNNSTQVATVNGVPADEYYGQFVWEESDAYYEGTAQFGDEVEGTNNVFAATFYVFADNSAVIFYREGEGFVTFSESSFLLDETTLTRIDTTWSIDGTQLLIGSSVECTGTSFNGNELLTCQLAESIVSADAVGTGFDTGAFLTGETPDDEKWAGYE